MKYKISKYTLFILDITIVLFGFLFAAKIRPGTLQIIQKYHRSFVPFILIWIGSGVWGMKYSLRTAHSAMNYLKRIFLCNTVAITAILTLMYIFGKFYYSRFIVFGTILTSFSLELFIFMGFYYAFNFRKENAPHAATRLVTRSDALEDSMSAKAYPEAALSVPTISNEAYIPPFSLHTEEDSILLPLWQRYLSGNQKLFDFINDFLDLTRFSKAKTLVLNSETYFNIENESDGSRQIFINLHKINDLRRINFYLIRVNELLAPGGVFVCNGQTITQRKAAFYKRFTPFLGVFLYALDFVIRRVFPKLPVLQGWYFALTKGRNRALSETEMLGRFYFCGFELINKREFDGQMHFILKKTKEPRTDSNPTYGPLIRLKRKGLGGKTIYVKKLRTMHPYSEYLQHYVYQTNALQEGGKFKDDFRITSWGRVFRKLWIDELPQLLNLLQGDVTLVGVRALSEHYFSLYPQDLQELRLKVKPGLLPPFYADMPVTFDDIVASERKYLEKKLKAPFRTDWTYFWKGVWNILVKRARSN
ncbi:MAG TPA: sugar transferase [Candidatus Cloacimonadota bacterium]|nr:sugar transferase [Candidatus Cloacimonadota bacterium]